MDALHRSILQTERSYLVENIEDVESIVDNLFQKEVLTESMKQEILQGEKTSVRRVRKLLDFLPKRGPFAFDTFCQVLIKNRHRHVAVHLNPTLAGQGATPLPPNSSETQRPSHQHPSEYHQQPSGTHRQPQGAVSNPRPEGTTGLPQPMSIDIHKKGNTGQTRSQDLPKPANQNPGYTRQPSRDISASQPEEQVQVFQFPEDWPESLNMAPFSSKDFKVDPCTYDDIRRISRQHIYRMCSPHHGRAMIINNQEFSGDGKHFAKRSCSEMDSNRLLLVLKSLSFQTDTKRDLNYDDMKMTLQRLKETDHEDAFILIILSYGGEGTVFCADGKEMRIQDIVDTFSTDKCRNLIGKPKLFFFQACGVKLEDGPARQAETEVDHAAGITQSLEGLSLRSQSGDVVDTNPGSDSGAVLPVDTSDSLVAMATGPDINSSHYGSLFILALSYVLCHCSKNQDLLTMLNRINQLNPAKFLKLCEVRSSLKQKLYFLPDYPLKGSDPDVDFPQPNPIPPPSFGSTQMA